MDCKQIQTLLYGYICETLSNKQQQATMEHLQSGCSKCNAKWQEIKERLHGIKSEGVYLSPKISAQNILAKARARNLWLRYIAMALLLGIFITLVFIALAIARYRHEHIMLEKLEKAIYIYRLEQGHYPKNGQNLFKILTQIPKTKQYLVHWENRINKEGKCVDHWGTPIIYTYPGVHNKALFDLHSCGRNRKNEDGKWDDIKNWFSE